MKLNNKNLDTEIEKKILDITNYLSKNKQFVVIELNFYQKIINYYITKRLENLWETWKFNFVLKNNQDDNIKINSENSQKQKENRIRKYIFDILEKVKIKKN